MEQKVITVIGGTGFLGRYVVKHLAQAGYRVRVVSRHPEAAGHLKTAGDPGQIALIYGNLGNPDSMYGKIDDSYAIINLVGLLYERGSQNFDTIHTHGAQRLAQMAKASGIQRFIQISALGVDRSPGSQYANSKLHGEKAVLEVFPEATILRPSVIFGPEDNFYNQFARMAGVSPVLPLIGGGKTRFQPVYAADVARAVCTTLEHPESIGQTYELAGPHVYSFHQIIEYIMHTINKRRILLPLPFTIAYIMGLFAEFMPKPLITRDQVQLLKYHNVPNGSLPGFAHLGITPTSVEMIVPEYLACYRNPNPIANPLSAS